MLGKFVTFEGGEGTGKSTQAHNLARRLKDYGVNTVVTREPGGSPGAEAIREVLLAGKIASLGPFAEAVLFAAARIDHVDKTIKPALMRGDWVICDRYTDSTRVYQGVAAGLEPEILSALERVATDGTTPDFTIILDLDPRIGLERARTRREASGDPGADRFERESVEHHQAIRKGFLEIAKSEPNRCTVIDAATNEFDVANAIWFAVDEKFGIEKWHAQRKP